jgi:hypothetical protein
MRAKVTYTILATIVHDLKRKAYYNTRNYSYIKSPLLGDY